MGLPDLGTCTWDGWTQPVAISVDGGNTWGTPAEVEAGSAFHIGVEYGNFSDMDVADVNLTVTVNNDVLFTMAKDVKGWYSYVQYYGLFAFNPGTYEIVFTIDPENKIKEDDESNNTYTYTLTVAGSTDWLIQTYWGQTSVLWDSVAINKYAPVDPQTKERCVTGCTNTAIAQILYYFADQGHDFTIDLTKEDAFTSGGRIKIDGTSSNAAKNGNLSFDEINSLLEDFEVESAEDVAALCFASAVILESSFGSSETSTYLNDDVFMRAGFKSAETAYKGYSDFWSANGDLSDAGWNMLKENIKSETPVLVSLQNPSHAVVIDGYDAESDMVHINFGWGIGGGKKDDNGLDTGSGWYSRNECNDLRVNGFVYNITPDTEKPVADGPVLCQYKDGKASLSLDFSDDVGVWKKYYRVGSNGTWLEYTGEIHLDKNATVYFKASDRGKNVSSIKSYSVCITVNNLQGSEDGLTWNPVTGAGSYIVEYSRDHFKTVVRFETKANNVDSFSLPGGTYQWRVKAEGREFSEGETKVVSGAAEPREIVSDKDGNLDIFFARAQGTWGAGYGAQHLGKLDGWEGTGEIIKLGGKNKIADVFTGSSTDANVLILTDDANGDALFIDDVYTSFGSDASRMTRIKEIRAGAGDDIVDMTSQRYAYTAGSSMHIYGGLGNDVIWANLGSNILYGDAGDDRIVGGSGSDKIIGGSGDDSLHGGGGSDTFYFGGDWGTDTVVQLAGGKVTLWFEEGSESNWDAANLIYTDGSNSVTVHGVSKSKVNLQFGTNDSVPEGAFADAASEKIFEDPNKGMLA